LERIVYLAIISYLQVSKVTGRPMVGRLLQWQLMTL